MAMQVELPSSINFDFNTGRASPFRSSPSSPKGFGKFYFSAPTSPARASEIFRELEDYSLVSRDSRGKASTSASPFDWEEKEIDDFAFATTKESEFLRPAEQLLKGSKIQPLKPQPYGVRVDEPETIRSPLLYPQSPRSTKSQRKKSLWSTFSPKRRKERDPGEAVANTTEPRREQGRCRERASALSTSRSGRREARSLSPSRVSKYPWEEEQKQPQDAKQSASTSKPLPSTTLTLSSSSKGSRSWRLKDFLLFRSASEGRASDKDPFKKYAHLYRKHEAAKNSGSSSTEGSNIVPASRRGPISAHELHYTINKAISQDMKKKSFLPYKQGILGRLAFNPTVHALAHGFGSLAQSHQ